MADARTGNSGRVWLRVHVEIQGVDDVHNTVMRTLTSSMLLSLLAWCGIANAQATDKLPLTGTWQYQPRGTSCAEQYYFRSDGTMMVTSGKEVTESTYNLSEKPIGAGFFAFEMQVTQTNGKSDCRGKQTAIGQRTQTYLRFQANGERLVLCRDSNLAACMGPLIRLKGRIGA